MRSLTFSIPTEYRTSPSVIPAIARSLCGTPAWVIEAGCSISVSMPPKDTAKTATLTRFMSAAPASKPPTSSKLMTAPGPLICSSARACWGCDGRPGYLTHRTSSRCSSHRAISIALVCARSMRSESVLSPR